MGIVSLGWGMSLPNVTLGSAATIIPTLGDECVIGPAGVATASLPPQNCVLVSWAMRPEYLSAADFSFTVQRSGSPGFRNADDFEVVAADRVGVTSYLDIDIDLQNQFRQIYYRIIATNIEDPSVQMISAVVRANQRPLESRDLVLREIRFRTHVLLAGWPGSPNPQGYTGVPCAIFLMKTYGQKCAACWDYVAMRVSDSKCTACFRTGFHGGYYAPLARYVQFSPAPKRPSLEEEGREHRTFCSALIEHDPLLQPGDLIRDIEVGSMWEVAQLEAPTTRKLNVGHQNAVLYLLDKDDVEQQVVGRFDIDQACRLEWGPFLG